MKIIQRSMILTQSSEKIVMNSVSPNYYWPRRLSIELPLSKFLLNDWNLNVLMIVLLNRKTIKE
jgi:hypothetical protein